MSSKAYDICPNKVVHKETGHADKKWSRPACCNVFTIAISIVLFLLLVGFIVILVLYFAVDTTQSGPRTDSNDVWKNNTNNVKNNSFMLRLRAECHGPAYWFQADTYNCRKYYQCYKGAVKEFTCSPGYAFLEPDADKAACVYPWLANCGERGYVTGDEEFRLIRLTLIIRNNVTENVTAGINDVKSMLTLSGVVPRNTLYYCMLLFNGTDGFSFQASHSRMFGEYLVSINGVAADYERGTYWQLLRNGAPLELGISGYIPDDDDVITFMYSMWANKSV